MRTRQSEYMLQASSSSSGSSDDDFISFHPRKKNNERSRITGMKRSSRTRPPTLLLSDDESKSSSSLQSQHSGSEKKKLKRIVEVVIPVYLKKNPSQKSKRKKETGSYHNPLCNFCGFPSSKGGPSRGNSKKENDDLFGIAHGSGPLIFCGRCSFAYHENCLTDNFAPLKVWKKTGVFHCTHCSKPSNCMLCNLIDPPVPSEPVKKPITSDRSSSLIPCHLSHSQTSSIPHTPVLVEEEHKMGEEVVISDEGGATSQKATLESENNPSVISGLAKRLADIVDTGSVQSIEMSKEDQISGDLPPIVTVGQSVSEEKNTENVKDNLETMKESDVIDIKDPSFQSDIKEMLPYDRNKFRCSRCHFIAHFRCILQTLKEIYPDQNEEENWEFIRKWKCDECQKWPWPIEKILTYREINGNKDKREFFVKFEKLSYLHLQWVPESWVKRVSQWKYRNFLMKYPSGSPAFETVVPPSYQTIQKLLDVSYDIQNNPIKIFVKWEGLGHDCSTWEDIPPKETKLFTQYEKAFKAHQEIETITPKFNERKNFHFKEIKSQPSFIQGGALKSYQLDGLNWLLFQWSKRNSCILADDMGLGKTVQIVAVISYLFHVHNLFPFLIVVPNSTTEHWVREFSKWAPQLHVVLYAGNVASREVIRNYELFRGKTGRTIKCHVVIATYETVQSETSVFSTVPRWEILVVDEGHRIKSEKGKLGEFLRKLHSENRMLLTGTPLQNNVRELFTLMNFLDPDKFREPKDFEEKYQDLNESAIKEIHSLLKPHFLRRVKADVLKHLPPKTEVIVPIYMTPLQKQIYKAVLSKNYKSLQSLQKSAGGGKRAAYFVLMELRKCTNHPYLFPDVEPDFDSTAEGHKRLIEACGKMLFLHSALKILREKGHRVLIFSTMTRVLDILEDYMIEEKLKYARLDGKMGRLDRQSQIDQFNEEGSSMFCFLISTRAGGVGINLASADTVIMFDPDFNPHADLQAISRAYRLGQTKPVLILKLLSRHTIEEKIYQIGRKKMVLDHLIVEKMDDSDLVEEDIESIIKYGAQTLFDEGEEESQITRKYSESELEEILKRKEKTEDQPDTEEDTNNNATAFQFEKIWATNNSDLQEDTEKPNEDDEDNDPQFWEKLLKDRAAYVETMDKMKNENLGRGKRRKAKIVYSLPSVSDEESRKKSRKRKKVTDDTEEYQAQQEGESSSPEEDIYEKEEIPELKKAKKKQQHQYNQALLQNLERIIAENPHYLFEYKNTNTDGFLKLQKLYLNPTTPKEVQELFRKYAYYPPEEKAAVGQESRKMHQPSNSLSTAGNETSKFPATQEQPLLDSNAKLQRSYFQSEGSGNKNPSGQASAPPGGNNTFITPSVSGPQPRPHSSDFQGFPSMYEKNLFHNLYTLVNRDPSFIATLRVNDPKKYDQLKSYYFRKEVSTELQRIFMSWANMPVPSSKSNISSNNVSNFISDYSKKPHEPLHSTNPHFINFSGTQPTSFNGRSTPPEMTTSKPINNTKEVVGTSKAVDNSKTPPVVAEKPNISIDSTPSNEQNKIKNVTSVGPKSSKTGITNIGTCEYPIEVNETNDICPREIKPQDKLRTKLQAESDSKAFNKEQLEGATSVSHQTVPMIKELPVPSPSSQLVIATTVGADKRKEDEKKNSCWLCDEGRHKIQLCHRKEDTLLLLQKRQALLGNTWTGSERQQVLGKLAQIRYFLKKANIIIEDSDTI